MATSKLLSLLRAKMRAHHYTYQTERAYEKWIKQFIRFHHMRHPINLSEKEVYSYLLYLANHKKALASEQNQALSAIAFLYKQVMHQPLKNVTDLTLKRDS